MSRVTVIDDSSEFLDLMGSILGTMGHQMTGLAAIDTAFEDVVATRPQLLIVDLRLENMPHQISGWELIVLARAHRDLVEVPVILCTGDVFELRRRSKELEQVAGVHVITKPFELDDVTALIGQLLPGS